MGVACLKFHGETFRWLKIVKFIKFLPQSFPTIQYLRMYLHNNIVAFLDYYMQLVCMH